MMAPTNERGRRAGEAGATGSVAPAALRGGAITALDTQRKRPDRRSLSIDGEFICGLPEAIVQELNWRVGQELTLAALQAGLALAERAAAREEALRWLASSARSRAEVLRRLQRHGYPPEVAEATVAWLTERQWLDDAVLARQYAESLRDGRRTLGQVAARRKLAARGIEPAVIDAALRAVFAGGDGELTAARAAAAQAMRRLGGLERRVAERRLAGALQRRGFGFETIRQVLRENLGEYGESS